MRLRGLHHVTAICRDLERTIAFYRDTLGLTIVRDAPSDDDPYAGHVWFDGGNGTFVTFMEYGHMPEGVVGTGSTHHFALRVETRASRRRGATTYAPGAIACSEVLDRGAFHSIYVRDPDGHVVEIATRGPVPTPASRPRSGLSSPMPRQLTPRGRAVLVAGPRSGGPLVHCVDASSSTRWSWSPSSGSTLGTGGSVNAPSDAGS